MRRSKQAAWSSATRSRSHSKPSSSDSNSVIMRRWDFYFPQRKFIGKGGSWGSALFIFHSFLFCNALYRCHLTDLRMQVARFVRNRRVPNLRNIVVFIMVIMDLADPDAMKMLQQHLDG